VTLFFNTNIQINGPKLVHMYVYGWAMTKEIFNYTGSLKVKISQKVFFLWGGANFWTHTVQIIFTCNKTWKRRLSPSKHLLFMIWARKI